MIFRDNFSIFKLYNEYPKKSRLIWCIFQFKYLPRRKQYKSAFGGIVTLLVYSLSLMYFIYKIQSWQSKQILPIITSQNVPQTYQEINFTNTISLKCGSFCFFGYYQDGAFINLTLLQPIANESSRRSSIFKPENLSLVLNTGSKTEQTPLGERQGFIYFKVCTMDPELTSYGQIVYHITQHYVDDNFLFKNCNINKQSLINSSGGHAGFLTLLISVNANQVEQYIQYPKLGYLLADVGSIMSILLSLSIIVQILNSKLIEDQLYFDIISFYFPDYKKNTIRKNLLGKITSITLKDHLVDQSQFLLHYELMKERAQEKFSVTNRIYEISRLQFVLQTLVDRQKLILSHQMGIKMLNQSMSTMQYHLNTFNLGYFTILSIYKIYEINEEEDQIHLQSPQQTLIIQRIGRFLSHNDTFSFILIYLSYKCTKYFDNQYMKMRHINKQEFIKLLPTILQLRIQNKKTSL
ncbi:hypothetical protein pb186bvf_009643 [Paramecium bursaria]